MYFVMMTLSLLICLVLKFFPCSFSKVWWYTIQQIYADDLASGHSSIPVHWEIKIISKCILMSFFAHQWYTLRYFGVLSTKYLPFKDQVVPLRCCKQTMGQGNFVFSCLASNTGVDHIMILYNHTCNYRISKLFSHCLWWSILLHVNVRTIIISDFCCLSECLEPFLSISGLNDLLLF